VADYRIVCITKDGIYPHDHVVSVGVGTSSFQWSVAQVRESLSKGHQFHTLGPLSGRAAHVRPFDCECGVQTIRSNYEAEPDNDLEQLNRCPR
jgi:hypothetical protein